MKLFKRAMALVLAGVMAVGAFTVTTASVKADEAVAEEYTIDENSAFRTDDVTKIKFKKEFADDTIHFYRQFNSSLSQLMIDMKKIQAEAEGVSWLHNIEVVLTDLEGNVYTLKYKGSGDKTDVVVTFPGGVKPDKSELEVGRTFKHTDIKIVKGLDIVDLFTLLSVTGTKTNLSGTYGYGGTKIEKIVTNADGSFNVTMQGQKYLFYVVNGVLYAQGDVTEYKAIRTWCNRNILEVEYIPEIIVNVYRIYNPNSGEHFYTTNRTEVEAAVKAGWNDEGSLCKAPKASNTPVYRVFNPNARDAGSHHFTISKKEKEDLVKAGWVDEGIAFYSASKDKGVKLLRAYNKNDGGHNFTTNESEQKSIVAAGWQDEGIAWYVYPLNK